MVKRMLIDATHPEETRVVVVNGTRLEELDVETSTKRQLKGNIYLAKIVRVEPSLQAAFVEYGGNRHGFLAFSEIHPDYFQIPVADRQALLAAQNAEGFRDSVDAPEPPRPPERPTSNSPSSSDEEPSEDGDPDGETGGEAEAGAENDGAESGGNGNNGEGRNVEVVGGDESSEQEMERRRARLLRNYKIQEVIKRRQIILVQVIKEERGNKGAALTTYLSLAGRYCVLMPNTARGGGVSRKIISAADRKRLKSIATELEIPEGMAVIIRTAGSERSKVEIKRDYEYLLRMWDTVRTLTLESSAPALVYEEASLIKRSIRDLYSRDIDEVIVAGDESYRMAKDYMRMLTPSHAKKVQPYKDDTMPLFHRYQVESQLDAMHSPVVQLRSGGYIVINQTEALVAIDVNSGRATRERHIEETAVKTNLEAADEVARQLRLRDLAGLIVIDFIDMEEYRNNHSVERRLKEALKTDRARIQVGRISAFGLLELSRQRLRPSLQETAFMPCAACGGTGLVRSVESAAVHILRAIEEEGIRRRSSEITVAVPTAIALYILNQKRDALAATEVRHQFRVFLTGDDSLIAPAFRMEKVRAEGRFFDDTPRAPLPIPDLLPTEDDGLTDEPADEETASEGGETAQTEQTPRGEDGGDGTGRRRRRRRRRGRPRNEDGTPMQEGEGGESDGESDGEGAEGDDTGSDEGPEDGAEGDESSAGAEGGPEGETEEQRARRRRRGRRGGRRRRQGGDRPETQADAIPVVQVTTLTHDLVADAFAAVEAAEEAAHLARFAAKTADHEAATAEPQPVAAEPVAPEPVADVVEKPKRTRRKKTEEVPAETAEGTDPVEKPKRTRRKKAEPAPEATAEPEPELTAAEAPAEPVAAPEPEPAPQPVDEPAPAPEPAPEPEEPSGPPRRGWWNRLLT